MHSCWILFFPPQSIREVGFPFIPDYCTSVLKRLRGKMELESTFFIIYIIYKFML
uniref:Uncharacterized protein n=1 Tax=Anguilla anguilla TaxID=7936 RepID=A0A0E9P8E9_ANGAN